MSARALLAELYRLGVKLEADGDHLRYRGPEEVIYSEMIERPIAYKAMSGVGPGHSKERAVRQGHGDNIRLARLLT
jgi:hypothetical protein